MKMSTNKWQDTVDAAIKHAKSNRSIRLEWRKFTEEKIKILEDLSVLPVIDFIHKFEESLFINDVIKEAINGDREFLQQCLNVCLDQQVPLGP